MATWVTKRDHIDMVQAADINRLQTLKADMVKATAAALGTLDEGELGFETDARRLLVGSSAGNTVVGGTHAHAEADITGLVSDLAGKAAASHGHAEADVTGLVADLAGKAASSHAHAPGDITGTAVITADARLSDARTPTAHVHAPADVTGTAVITTDVRLSDARTPLTHNHAGADINSGTLDGDRLPALSETKKGAAPATGTPSGKFLKDDGTWATPADGGGLGYALQLMGTNLVAPADGSTFYIGSQPLPPSSTAGIQRLYIPKAGTIKAAYFYAYSVTAGSAEEMSCSIRLNNTSDTLVQAVSVSDNDRLFSNVGLDIAVVPGDFIEGKFVFPTWATNPANLRFAGTVYIE